MAEEERTREYSEESVKLFVGQVPKLMTEQQLLDMFKEFAVIDQVNIIKDKTTRASRGCSFLICPSREEADKAITACHNKQTLPGASSPLQVKYADGELERLEHKLFVGMLPKNVSDLEVSSLFSEYGTITDLQILRGSQQTSRGYAFLKYEKKEQAVAAVEALNGKHTMEGATVPLVVKWADTERERQARRAQKALSQASNASNSGQHPSIYGSLSMGYMTPYNGYAYQTPGTYGLMQYSQLSVQNMVPSINQGGTPRGVAPGTTQRNYAMSPGSYLASAYRAAQGLQYPTRYPGGITGYLPPYTTNRHSAESSSAGSNTGGQVEGPGGANLFIYHIPQEFGDQELANTFREFGTVLSAKVFVDKASGVSKCFGMNLRLSDVSTIKSISVLMFVSAGFVSYDSPDAAQSAIKMMNGFQLDGKKLKVQLKRENKHNKPY